MSDKELRQEVLDELRFDAGVNSEDITVAVHEGAVTLSGSVSSYGQRVAAEHAAHRVKGVHSVVLELKLKLPAGIAVADSEIAERALKVLKWNSMLPPGAVQLTVQGGWITLTGEVEWQYQRLAAEDAVRPLRGVVAVIDNIAVKQRAQIEQVKHKIQQTLKRRAEHEAGGVTVAVCGDTVTLNGRVRDQEERAAVRNAAASAPGVGHIEDCLIIA